ncbi:MAG: branched-chain amino acid ABC transporter permease [Conexivisphaera sp.]|jgi:branched-chain amino acid transport system permease protein
MAAFLIPSYLISTTLYGLLFTSIYLLLATGLTLIFGTLKLVNFAHGDLMVLGAFVAFLFVTLEGWSPYLAMVPAVLVIAGIGVLIYRFTLRPAVKAGPVNMILLTIGISYILENALAYYFLPVYRTGVEIPSPLRGTGILLPSNVLLTYDEFLTIVISWAIMGVLYYWLFRTRQGIAIRALSQNPVGASISGIDVNRLSYLTFIVGSALAAIAGTLYGIMFTFNPFSGVLLTLMAFAVMILGGVGSIPGTMVGSIIIGFATSFVSYYMGQAWGEAIAFIILAVILLVRPSGIFRGG